MTVTSSPARWRTLARLFLQGPEGDIFPQTFRTVLVVVGVIWIVQGLGILETGSFMDRRPFWAVAGAVMLIAGVVSTLVHRRKAGAKDGDHPGS